MESAYIIYFLHFLLRILFLKKPFVYKSKRLVYYVVPKENVFSLIFFIIKDHLKKTYNFSFRINPYYSEVYIFLGKYLFPYVPFIFVENFFYHLIYYCLWLKWSSKL